MPVGANTMASAAITSASDINSRVPICPPSNRALLYTPTMGIARVLIDAIAVGNMPINVYHTKWHIIIGTKAEYSTAISPAVDNV